METIFFFTFYCLTMKRWEVLNAVLIQVKFRFLNRYLVSDGNYG